MSIAPKEPCLYCASIVDDLRERLAESERERDSYIAVHTAKVEALLALSRHHEETLRELDAVRDRGANAVLVPADKLAELRAALEQAEADAKAQYEAGQRQWGAELSRAERLEAALRECYHGCDCGRMSSAPWNKHDPDCVRYIAGFALHPPSAPAHPGTGGEPCMACKGTGGRLLGEGVTAHFDQCRYCGGIGRSRRAAGESTKDGRAPTNTTDRKE